MTGAAIDPGALLTWLRPREAEMSALLGRLVEAESPSSAPPAQEAVQALLTKELSALGFRVRRVRGRGAGDHLLAAPAIAEGRAAYQLIIGHLDTVWPVGTLVERPAVEEQGQVAGPGAYDMKAGLVQGIFALRALAEHQVAPPATPIVFVNSDEEVGSVDSRRHLRRLARIASRAFVLEASYGPAGALKTGRKGVARFKLTVHGKAAHAGNDPDAGVSAILELSHQVQALFALNDPASGVTVNVGQVDGGLRPNVIAPEASAMVEARVPTQEAATRIEAAIRSLTPVQEGTSLEVDGGFGRLPMEETERNLALWSQAQTIADELAIPLEKAVVGGASDGNITSLYTATLDGLGPVGDGAHAAHEYVLTAKMPERAALLASLLVAALPAAAGRG